MRYIWPPTNVYAAANLLGLLALAAAVVCLALGRRRAALSLAVAAVLLCVVPGLVGLLLYPFIGTDG